MSDYTHEQVLMISNIQCRQLSPGSRNCYLSMTEAFLILIFIFDMRHRLSNFYKLYINIQYSKYIGQSQRTLGWRQIFSPGFGVHDEEKESSNFTDNLTGAKISNFLFPVSNICYIHNFKIPRKNIKSELFWLA